MDVIMEVKPKLHRRNKISYKEDRVAWNQAWERQIDDFWGTDQTFKVTPDAIRRIDRCGHLLDWVPEALYDGIMNDSSLQTCQVMRYQTCVLQRDLSKKAALRFALQDFENRWQKLDPKEREKWILEGLVRACDAQVVGEHWRRFCPEMTIARMNYQSGKGYLDLLAYLVGKDDQIPEDVRMVPNPVWDLLNTSKRTSLLPGQRVMQRANDVQRTTFLTYFVWNLLLAFYGEIELSVHSKLKDTCSKDEQVQSAFEKIRSAGGWMAQGLKESAKATKDYNRNAIRTCIWCGRGPHQGVTNVLACQKCKDMGRYVYYCSRECQVKDWKQGKPPHKAICGNTEALAASCLGDLPSSNKSESKWGTPEPGFTRSPYLLYQLEVLTGNAHYDYLLVRPEPKYKSDRVVMFPDPTLKKLFLDNLRIAACKFAPREVHVMYQMLLPWALMNEGVGKDGLKSQLKREYGVDIRL
ncbi:hypothetical protein VKT23_013750 [Stygiomarasmius scandens]|uniref:MYND-type domain-containing protein n=1 Tax=Marasmiellus scandens TaxID=2682957 RepID=A0ABR1J1D0_9AGAR